MTLRSLMRVPPLDAADVVAGRDALDREVSWPATVRLRAPALEPLSGNELIIAPVETLRSLDPPLALGELTRQLAGRAVAGIVVLGEPDPAGLAVAEERGVAVLRLAASHNVQDLAQTISQTIVALRTQLYQRGLDIHHELAEVSIAGLGPEVLIDRLAALTGRRVLLIGEDGTVSAAAAPVDTVLPAVRGERVPDVAAWAALFAERSPVGATPPTARLVFDRPAGETAALAAPVVVRDRVVAYLALLGTADRTPPVLQEWTDEDYLALERGSTVCALELAKQEAVSEAERRLRGNFFEDLLSERRESDETLMARARHLGFDLLKPHAVVVIGGVEAAPPAAPPITTTARRRAADALRAARSLLTGWSGHPAVGDWQDTVVALVPLAAPPDLAPARRVATELVARLQSELGPGARAGGLERPIPVVIGIGRYHEGIEGLRAAHGEATRAVQIGRQIFGPGRVIAFGDLGVYRLLFVLRESPELRAFCDELLSTLVDYDQKNGAALVETLEAYFNCNGSVQDAAEALFLHRNSVAYRLRRVRELTGLDLENREDSLRLQLALKARHVLAS